MTTGSLSDITLSGILVSQRMAGGAVGGTYLRNGAPVDEVGELRFCSVQFL